MKARRPFRKQAERIARERMKAAGALLGAAQLPETALTVADLVAFEPHQWATLLKLAGVK